MNKLSRSVPVALIFSLFVANHASAWVYGAQNSGTSCVPETNNTANVIYSGWGLENNSSGTVTVHCGGAHHGPNNTFGITVTVYDRTPTANDFCCTARILNNDGTIIASSASKCAPTYGSAVQTLSIGSVAAVGMVDIQCSVPKLDASNGKSVLASYSYGQ